jgi:transposase
VAPRVYVGIDLGTRVCEAVAKREDGTLLEKLTFSLSEKALRQVVANIRGEVHVAIEEGELSWWASQCIRSFVARVAVLDPKVNTWIYKDARKNDVIDAGKLADLLRLGVFREVFQPETAEMADFKKVVTHFEAQTKRQTRWKNRIKGRFRREGVLLGGRGCFGKSGRGRCLSLVPSPASRWVIEEMYSELDLAVQSRRRARRKMLELARRIPVIPRFLAMPGIAEILACRFVAYVQTPHRFRSKRQLWSYCGLGVMERSSDGRPLGRKHLGQGVGPLKDLSRKAFQAAMGCREENLFQRHYRSSLEFTGDPMKARLNTQRKILAVMWAMWRKGTEYRDDFETSGLEGRLGAA